MTVEQTIFLACLLPPDDRILYLLAAMERYSDEDPELEALLDAAMAFHCEAYTVRLIWQSLEPAQAFYPWWGALTGRVPYEC